METEKKKTKINKNAILAIVMSILMIGSVLAFISARDTRVNTIFIGDVDITLNEVFENYSQKQVGDVVTKKPSITNNGDSPCWAYVVLVMDTLPEEDIGDNSAYYARAVANGEEYKDGLIVDVYGIGIQNMYGGESNNTSALAWNDYIDDADFIEGNVLTGDTGRESIFSVEGVDTTNWTLVDTFETDANLIYMVYGYNTLLDTPKAHTDYDVKNSVIVNTTTDAFTGLKLREK